LPSLLKLRWPNTGQLAEVFGVGATAHPPLILTESGEMDYRVIGERKRRRSPDGYTRQ
jgi:hypothetical protein